MSTSQSKLVCWALFDSETGDYTSTVHKYFDDKIDIYGVGISHYGKDICLPYGSVLEMASGFIKKLGGFEKLAEWGLF